MRWESKLKSRKKPKIRTATHSNMEMFPPRVPKTEKMVFAFHSCSLYVDAMVHLTEISPNALGIKLSESWRPLLVVRYMGWRLHNSLSFPSTPWYIQLVFTAVLVRCILTVRS